MQLCTNQPQSLYFQAFQADLVFNKSSILSRFGALFAASLRQICAKGNMASIRKRGKTWRAEIRRKGESLSASFATKGEAVAWSMEREAEIVSVARGGVPKKTLGDALRKYSAEVSPTKKGERWEQIRINAFLSGSMIKLQKKLLEDVTTPLLAEWRDARLKEVAPASVRRELNLLGSVLEMCRREWHWLHENPLRDVRKPTSPAARRRGVSTNEIDRITLALGYEAGKPVATMSQQVAVAFLLSLETAMRQGEILALVPDRVDLVRRFVTLEKTKNGDERQVPLSSVAVVLLESVGCQFAVKSSSADSLFRRGRNAAGFHDVHFHDARSEALTKLSKKFDVLSLARIVGHRDLKSLMLYYNETAEDMAKKLD